MKTKSRIQSIWWLCESPIRKYITTLDEWMNEKRNLPIVKWVVCFEPCPSNATLDTEYRSPSSGNLGYTRFLFFRFGEHSRFNIVSNSSPIACPDTDQITVVIYRSSQRLSPLFLLTFADKILWHSLTLVICIFGYYSWRSSLFSFRAFPWHAMLVMSCLWIKIKTCVYIQNILWDSPRKH